MTPTERLHYDDARLTRFESRVIAVLPGRVALAETAFYAEAGGQLADRGTLRFGGVSSRVSDVQVDDAGVVWHHTSDELPEVGAPIEGEIELGRRLEHMALHSAQHLLSRALSDLGANTVSARLGESAATIDVDAPDLGRDELARALASARRVISENRPVRAWFPTSGELASLALRRAPKVSGRVRVVDLGGYDLTPCGGTHVLTTSEIGLVAITKSERYKGMLRITFVAGRRSEALFDRLLAQAAELSQRLSAPLTDLGAGLDQLQGKLEEARQQVRQREAALIAEAGARLLAAPATTAGALVAALDGVDAPVLRALVKQLASRRGETVALVGRQGAEQTLVCARGARDDRDASAIVRAVCGAAGGRGGGRPELAEARFPAEADLEGAVHAALVPATGR